MSPTLKQLTILSLMLFSYLPSIATEAEQNPIITKINSNLFFPHKLKHSDKAALISFDVQPLGHITNLTITDNGVAKEIVNQCVLAINKSVPFANISEVQHINFSCKNEKFDKKKSMDKDTQQYFKALEKKIKFHWHPTKSKSSYQVGLKFKVDSTGKAYDIKTVLSSGNADYDLIALKAVENASPFAALPPSYLAEKNTDHMDIEYTFDYNIKTPYYRSNTYNRVNLGLNLLDLFVD